MALRLLGPINKVINQTTSEILDGQIINKATGIVTTFLTAGVEVIRDITAENPEEEYDEEEESDNGGSDE